MRQTSYLVLFALVLLGCSGNDSSVENQSPLGKSIVSDGWHYTSQGVYSIDNATGTRTMVIGQEKVIGVSKDASVFVVSGEADAWGTGTLRFLNKDGSQILSRALRVEDTYSHLLSPSGTKIAYDLGGSVAVEPIGSIGTATINLQDQVDYLIPLAFNPDESKVLVMNWKPQDPSLYLAPATGGTANPIAGTEGTAEATFSLDGSKIIFATVDRIWQVPTSGGTPALLATDEARNLRLTSDGKWIIYNRSMTDGEGKPQITGLYRIPTTGGTPTLVREGPDELYVVID